MARRTGSANAAVAASPPRPAAAMAARTGTTSSSTPPSSRPATLAPLATAPNTANARPRIAGGTRRPSSTAAATFTPPLPRPPSTLTGASQPTAGTVAISPTPRQVSASEPRRSRATPASDGRRRATHQPPATAALTQTLSISPYTPAVECSVARMKNTSATLTRLAAATTAPTRTTAARTSGSRRTPHSSRAPGAAWFQASSRASRPAPSPPIFRSARAAPPPPTSPTGRAAQPSSGTASLAQSRCSGARVVTVMRSGARLRRRAEAPRRVRIRRPAAAMAR